MNDFENDQALRALAAVVAAIRGDWQPPGILAHLTTAAAKHPYPDVALAAVRAATDRGNRTPAVIPMDGRHWQPSAAPPAAAAATVLPPRPGEWCPEHPGQWRDGCAGCKADRVAAPAPAPSIRDPLPGRDRDTPGRRAARDAVAALARS